MKTKTTDEQKKTDLETERTRQAEQEAGQDPRELAADLAALAGDPHFAPVFSAYRAGLVTLPESLRLLSRRADAVHVSKSRDRWTAEHAAELVKAGARISTATLEQIRKEEQERQEAERARARAELARAHEHANGAQMVRVTAGQASRGGALLSCNENQSGTR